jgi:signal transduction histidine kinase
MTAPQIPQKIIPRAFPGISPEEVKELLASSQVHVYPIGTTLCQEDEVELTFYLILEGEVNVTKNVNNKEIRKLKTLYAGDFFGEMAIIHNAPRAASVTAATQVTVMEIRKESFDRVLQHSSSVSMAMVREISNRLRENDEMAVEDLRMRASELARAYQQLAEQELARREFLTNIAHELRTPLMAAGGYMQLLQQGAIPPGEVKKTIGTVSRQIQQITTLVNDILFLQEMDLILPKFEAIHLEDIAKPVVEKYQKPAQAAKLTLNFSADPDLPPVNGDAKSLERALTALLDNAIKFSPNGGKVEVRLRREGRQVLTEVQDQGIGIPTENLPRIFDRFYHVEKSGDKLFGGIGLGLAITRQVIEQHNGTLEVHSQPGSGTTFTMRLGMWKKEDTR